MLDLTLRRLLWKEWRETRALLGGAIFAAAAFIFGVALCDRLGKLGLTPFIVDCVFLLPTLYVLAVTASIFTVERERGTLAFLSALPCSPQRVFFSKFALACISTCAFIAAIGAITAIAITLNHTWRAALRPRGGPALFFLEPGEALLIAAETFAWGTLVAPRLRNPLAAICGTIGAVIATAFLSGEFSIAFFRNRNWDGIAAGLRFVVLAITSFLAWRAAGSAYADDAARKTETSRLALGVRSCLTYLSARLHGPLWRLLWQYVRESGWLVPVLLAVLSLTSAYDSSRRIGETQITGLVLTLCTAAIGASVFFLERRTGGFQFFAEHGIHPRTVWWGRILSGALGLLCISFWMAVSFGRSNTLNMNMSEHFQNLVARYTSIGVATFDFQQDWLSLAIVSFSIGQAVSLSIRSGVMGFLIGTVISLPIPLYLAAARYYGLPFWLAVAVPACIFLGWTWFHCELLLTRGSIPKLSQSGAMLLGSLVVWCGALIAHRIYEVPDGFSPYADLQRSSHVLRDSPPTAITSFDYDLGERVSGGVRADEDQSLFNIYSRLDLNSRFPEGESFQRIEAMQEFFSTDDPEVAVYRNFAEWFVESLEKVPEPESQDLLIHEYPSGMSYSVSMGGNLIHEIVAAEAECRIQSGDFEGSLKAILSLLRYSQRLRCFFTEQNDLQANATHEVALRMLCRWASFREVSPDRTLAAVAEYEKLMIRPRIPSRTREMLAFAEIELWNENADRPPFAPKSSLRRFLFWERMRSARLIRAMYVHANGTQQFLANTRFGLQAHQARERSVFSSMYDHHKQMELSCSIMLRLYAYRKTHGKWPAKLEEAVPVLQNGEEQPEDVINFIYDTQFLPSAFTRSYGTTHVELGELRSRWVGGRPATAEEYNGFFFATGVYCGVGQQRSEQRILRIDFPIIGIAYTAEGSPVLVPRNPAYNEYLPDESNLTIYLPVAEQGLKSRMKDAAD